MALRRLQSSTSSKIKFLNQLFLFNWLKTVKPWLVSWLKLFLISGMTILWLNVCFSTRKKGPKSKNQFWTNLESASISTLKTQLQTSNLTHFITPNYGSKNYKKFLKKQTMKMKVNLKKKPPALILSWFNSQFIKTLCYFSAPWKSWNATFSIVMILSNCFWALVFTTMKMVYS